MASYVIIGCFLLFLHPPGERYLSHVSIPCSVQVGNVYSSQWILEAMYKNGTDYGHDGLGLLLR